jgi:hypothetical protein
MAVLKFLVLTAALAGAAIVACYSPESPDCALACTADSDCVADQTCTTDHLCAASSITSCGEHHTNDAGTGSGSGSGQEVDIKVHLDGQGGVHSSNSDNCDSIVPLVCTFKAPLGHSITLTATPHSGKQFDKWMGPPCMDANNPCTTTPQGMIDVTPKFKN